jgi:hypothetical protein
LKGIYEPTSEYENGGDFWVGFDLWRPPKNTEGTLDIIPIYIEGRLDRQEVLGADVSYFIRKGHFLDWRIGNQRLTGIGGECQELDKGEL